MLKQFKEYRLCRYFNKIVKPILCIGGYSVREEASIFCLSRALHFFSIILSCLFSCLAQAPLVGQSNLANEADWQWQHPSPQGNRLYDVHALNEREMIAVGEVGTILKTTDGGDSWTLKQSPSNVNIETITFIDQQIGWAAGSQDQYSEIGAILQTVDGGETWKTLNSEVDHITDIQFLDDQTGWYVGYYGKIAKTNDGGKNWIHLNSDSNVDLISIFFWIQISGGWPAV